MTSTHGTAGTGRLRWGGLAGMAMYPLFALTVIVLTWLQWDFLHDNGWRVRSSEINYPSSLARGEYGPVQVVNFLLLGALALVFLLGIRTQFVHRRTGQVATVALGVFVLAGLFNAVPTGLPGEPQSWQNGVHTVGFFMTMLGCLVGTVAAGLALRGAPGWGRYWIFAVAGAPAAVAAAVVLTPAGQYAFYALISILLIWFAVIGFRMHQLAAMPPRIRRTGPPRHRATVRRA